MRTENPRDVVCVYLPEYVERHWWDQFLHNQTALVIMARLHFMANTMITSVPYLLPERTTRRRRVEERAQPND